MASLFFRPHLLLASSSARFISAPISRDLHTSPTKKFEQSNFSANRALDHLRGSAARSARISSRSAGVRWYFFVYGCRIGGGRSSSADADAGNGRDNDEAEAEEEEE